MTLPSFFPLSMDAIVIVSAAVLLVIYHFVLVRWCDNTRQINVTEQAIMPENSGAVVQEFPSIVKDSINDLIATCKFSKSNINIIGLGSKSYDQDATTCAICLCEFEDGEAIRVLPECLHLFHVVCIDKWLYSHSSCPLCRADTPVRDIAAGL